MTDPRYHAGGGLTTSMSGVRIELSIWVPGQPAPQGSKDYKGHRTNRRTGKSAPVLVESSKRVKPWRETVAKVAALHWRGRPLLDGPLGVQIAFIMRRPVGTPKSAQPYAIKRTGDNDKLVRSIFDALTGVVWLDDCLVVDQHATKRIAAHGCGPGARITVWRIPEGW